jgi:hypothetical protein
VKGGFINMVESINPEDVFSAFEVFGLVKPMAGTFHVVDLQIEDSASILERNTCKTFTHFHDAGWLKEVGMTLLYAMSQSPQPIFGFASANCITILYKVLPAKYSGTKLISTTISDVSSFLGNKIGTVVKYNGTLLEFPNPKILTTYFLWKQNINRRIMIESLSLEALISKGISVKEAQETLLALGDTDTKLSLISDFLNKDPLPSWHTNGVAAYWAHKDEGIRLTLHQNLPSGPDFLTFMIDIFDQE